MSENEFGAWWRRYEGPALLVALVGAIGTGGASLYQLSDVAAREGDMELTMVKQGNRVTALEANHDAVKDDLNEIKETLRDINNMLRTRR